MTRILIVDDDASLRKTLSAILKAKGYATVGAAKGKTALAKAEKEKPAVALVDLKLPDMDGLEVVKEIKERSPGTECILLTGHASQASAIEAVNLGVYSYAQKPYDVEQLLVTIRRAIEKRESERALRDSVKQWHATFDAMNDSVCLIDVEGRIQRCNKATVELLGKPSTEILGKFCWKVVHGRSGPVEGCPIVRMRETGRRERA